MATIGADMLTLADHAKRMDPTGRIAVIAELLNQTNSITQDILFRECNNGTAHRLTTRTGLPTVVFRILNKGVKPSKSTTGQSNEGTGMIEGWSETDKDLAEKDGNVNEFRMSEASPFIESMNQKMVSTWFYGNSSLRAEEFTGLATRYSDKSAAIGRNIIDAGGTGSDNTSVWLLCHGKQTIFGLFPKGTQAGLVHRDLGLGVIETTNGVAGERMLGYREQWQWKVGLALKDWRFGARIANLDVSDLIGETSAADITKRMINAQHKMPSLNFGPCVFYMNRTVFEYLDIQRHDKVKGAGMEYKEVDGILQPHFRNIPIRIVDQLVNTEARVT